uniref:Triple QxxK/R motif-containing protein n=1 Tax=Xenopus tropicalis TaxID=8364 RepID=A0A6I8QF62_XENTR
MGKKDASTSRIPVDQYRKQIGRQDYKKNKPVLKATRLKAEAKKTAIGIKCVYFTQVPYKYLRNSIKLSQDGAAEKCVLHSECYEQIYAISPQPRAARR